MRWDDAPAPNSSRRTALSSFLLGELNASWAGKSETKWEPSVIGKTSEGSPGGENITKRGFLLDTRSRFPRPHNHCEHASEARARLGEGNTEAKRTPSAVRARGSRSY